jgi:hypothetical protein
VKLVEKKDPETAALAKLAQHLLLNAIEAAVDALLAFSSECLRVNANACCCFCCFC